MPQNIYDNADFYEEYKKLPRSRKGLPGAPEWPALQGLLPPVQGFRILDLGCGFGAFARWAQENGAESVLGVDLSTNMLERARALTTGDTVTYLQSSIEELQLPDHTFDLVYSSLALHYVEDYDAVVAKIRRLLVEGGRLVVLVEHPIYTASANPGWQTDADGRRFWPVDGYQLEGERVTNWLAPGVVKYHRTIASYVNGLIKHGFHIDRLVEWKPSPEQIEGWADLAEELDRPTFLMISAHI